MTTKSFFSTVLVIVCFLSFGANEAAAQKKGKDNLPENTIVPQVNPLVIELETFEGHSLGGGRNFIGIMGDKIEGRIAYVNGMVRVGRLSGKDALVFNKCEAEVGEPRVNKKGTNYSFDVHADDASFFGSNSNTDWCLSITVYNDGGVIINISSDSITRVYGQGVWTFMGRVNTERTLTLKKIKEMDPQLSDF